MIGFNIRQMTLQHTLPLIEQLRQGQLRHQGMHRTDTPHTQHPSAIGNLIIDGQLPQKGLGSGFKAFVCQSSFQFFLALCLFFSLILFHSKCPFWGLNFLVYKQKITL